MVESPASRSSRLLMSSEAARHASDDIARQTTRLVPALPLGSRSGGVLRFRVAARPGFGAAQGDGCVGNACYAVVTARA
jgi:hypothetical protein